MDRRRSPKSKKKDFTEAMTKAPADTAEDGMNRSRSEASQEDQTAERTLASLLSPKWLKTYRQTATEGAAIAEKL